MFCTNVLQDSVHEEWKSEEIIPNVRGVCGCISLADVNFKAESRIIINIFSYYVIMWPITSLYTSVSLNEYITAYF